MVASCVFVLLVSLVLQPIHRAYAEEIAPQTTLPEPAPELVEGVNETATVSTASSEEPPAGEVSSEPVAESVIVPASEEPLLGSDDGDGYEATTTPPAVMSTGATTTSPEPENSVALSSDGANQQPSISAARTTPDLASSSVSTTSETTLEATNSIMHATSTDGSVVATTSEAGIGEEVMVATTTPLATSTVADAINSAEDTASTADVLNRDPVAESSTDNESPSYQESEPTALQSTPERALATTSTTTNQPAVVTHTTEQNAHQFAKENCVVAGNGAYYCTRDISLAQLTETGVFAAPDADGDTEIFVQVAGETRQLTTNLVDDASPHYDSVSERIVWHRLAGDRYQIVAYDFTTEQERVLTDTSYNNMEPVSFGDLIVWQAWRGGDWEIMLYDGAVTIQLTSNEYNDVAPSLYGDFVMWQAQVAEGTRVAVYNITTGATDYLAAGVDVQAAENPRMVLMYDQVDTDGSVSTFGFDVRSGETIPLGGVPRSLPERLPEPEAPGSDKALVQTQLSVRDGDERDAAPVGSDDSNDNATTTNGSSSIAVAQEGDLVVGAEPMLASSTATTTTTDIPDVVIDATSTATTTTASGTSVAHIPDVVVPPVASSSSSTTQAYDE